MPSRVFAIFRQAVLEHRQVLFRDQDATRHACPHIVGYGPNGDEEALLYQFSAVTWDGEPVDGKWISVGLAWIGDATLLDGTWHTAPDVTRPRSCVIRPAFQKGYGACGW